MGRKFDSTDILSAKVIAVDPQRGKSDTVNGAFNHTTVNCGLSLTTTVTAIAVDGAGVLGSLAFYGYGAGDTLVRVLLDGESVISATASLNLANPFYHPVIGAWVSGVLYGVDEMPFRESCRVLVSNTDAAATTTVTARFTYRLVQP